ncbi:MAG: hypothetical protein HQ567_15145 [Candidatus Nealsonbacteria bacterium]|nr:hypothetical protein [Candidatus Nealsonbacteria bacterium]
MKSSILVLMLALAAILVVVAERGRVVGQDPNAAAEKKPPPLLLDDDPPLLLDDDEPLEENGTMADNERCHVCHLNFADEDIATVHAKAGMDCMKCHEDCDEHIADESWAIGGNGTAPGRMFLRKDIDAFCQKCHPEHDVSAREVLAHWQKRLAKKPPPLGVDPKTLKPEEIVCTDCHGDHHMYLEKRKCKWK